MGATKDGHDHSSIAQQNESSKPDPSNADNDSPPKGLEDDLDSEDPFTSGFLSRGPSSFSNAVRVLGIGSGTGTRVRTMVESLSKTEDPSIQLITLQDMAQTLLMAQEDSLQGQMSSDAMVKELVSLMQNSAFGVEIPMMACRCIANLMEVLPSSVANVVYGNAVPVLCQKLLEPEFLDVAEQALSVSHTFELSDPPLSRNRRSRRFLSNFHPQSFVKAVLVAVFNISTFSLLQYSGQL